jgi:hypothetical protein
MDVTRLPEENIYKDCLYRLTSATFIHNRHVVDNSICYIVNKRAEIGEPATNLNRDAITAYYNLNDNQVYGYLDEALAAAFSALAGVTIEAGWYNAAQLLPIAGWDYAGVVNNINEDPNDSTIRLLFDTKVYIYQNDWIELTNSIVDEKLPTPERNGHFAYTVQRRDGKDAYELHLISHAINEGYENGELMYPYQIPLRENGIIKTAEPKEDLDAANKKYVDDNFAPRITTFDEEWGHNRVYYIKNPQLTEEGNIPATTETSVEIPVGKSIMVCAISNNNESDYSYIDASGNPIAPPSVYGWEGALATPTVTINETTASWEAIEGATGYNYIIGTVTAYNSSSNSFAKTYNRAYVERTNNRGVYSRYALSTVNAPKDPDPADFACDVGLDSIPMRMSNGYIMAPIIKADNKAALDKIAERGYSLDYYLMPKSYTDSYVDRLFTMGENGGLIGNGDNINTGSKGLSMGIRAKVGANQAFAFGEDIEIGENGWTSFVANKENKANHFHTFIAGRGNESGTNCQTVVGQYAEITNNYRFHVGVGSSANDRKTGFGVTTSGNAQLLGNLWINGTPTENKHATTKLYVDNQVNNINKTFKDYATTEYVDAEIDKVNKTIESNVKTITDNITAISNKIPTATTDDNGKFLMVVDGKISLVNLDIAEEGKF